MSEQAASNTGEVKNPANNNVVTESDFLAARIGQLSGASVEEVKTETVPEGEAGKSDATEPEVKEEAQTEGAKPETKEDEAKVLSQIDFEKLSEAEIMELASKARSKALARFGELTADKKALQSQIAQLQAELQKVQKPALDVAPQIPKEYATIEKVEDLQAKMSESKATMEWAEARLDDAEHLGANDSIETEYGVFTKAKLKELYRLSRKAKDEWIPAQYAELQTRAKRASLREAYDQKAKQEIDWLAGEDNDVRKQYEALVKSPLVEKIKKVAPEVEADLGYVLAHAVNSIHGRKYHNLTPETPKKPAPSITPPSPVKASVASKGDEVTQKAIRDLEQRVQTTRSEDDFVALRTAQLAKRRN